MVTGNRLLAEAFPYREPTMSCRQLLVVIVLLALAGRAPAGILFGRKTPKPTPAERVPELIGMVKTDGDENKRLDAIAELRQYDATAFPNIVPVLIEVLLTDKKPAVRAEAAQSLGKLRPISQDGGQALEQALQGDTSMRVRLQARHALLQYHWSGYHSAQAPPLPGNAGKDAPSVPPAVNSTAKKPTLPPGPAVTNLPPVRPQPIQPSRYPPPSRPTTAEPPLAIDPVPAAPAPLPLLTPPALQPAPRQVPTRMPVGPAAQPPAEGGPDLGSPPN
jgi:hypothetical protein